MIDFRKEEKLLIDYLFSDNKAVKQRMQSEIPDWNTLVDLSTAHLVTPILYHRFTKSPEPFNIPAKVMQRMHSIYIQCAARNVQFRYDLTRALRCVVDSGIPCILLKGACLQEFVYEDIGLRVMEDVDLLFKKKDLHKAQACLVRGGYLRPDSPLPIDMHWYIEQYIDMDMKRIWEAARPAEIDGINIMILSPAHLILHLCVHLSFHHQFQFAGLRTLYDLLQVIDQNKADINWPEVIRSAEELGVGNGVYLTLFLASEIAGAFVPKNVLEGMKPASFELKHIKWAIEQMFRKKEDGLSLSPYFWKLWQADSLKSKSAHLRKLLFPDKQFLSQKYPSSIQSNRDMYYYLLRMKDHFHRYLHILWKVFTRDENILRLVKEKKYTHSMMEWIAANGDRLL